MANNFPPAKDADLQAMSTAASAQITLSPPTYNLSTGQASTLAGLVTAFTSAMAAIEVPATRTPTKIAEKKAARAALVANLRDLNRYVQASKLGPPGGNVVNYTNAPSDIADNAGRQLAAIAGMAF